jgi:hypothetical protein
MIIKIIQGEKCIASLENEETEINFNITEKTSNGYIDVSISNNVNLTSDKVQDLLLIITNYLYKTK